MKKVFLHIGPHKTASTYLQNIFYHNMEKLRKSNIYYPKTGISIQWGHHELAHLLQKNDFTHFEQLLNKIIYDSNENDILISSENFDRLSDEQIKYLKEVFKNFDVKIIFVKRKLDELLLSNWQESIKHGHLNDFYTFAFEHVLKPYRSNVLNQKNIIDKYSNAFGKENIIIIDYNNAVLNKRDLSDIFFESIEKFDLLNLGTNKLINKSLSYKEVEIIRGLNNIYFAKNNKRHKKIFKFFKKNKDKNSNIIKNLYEIIDKYEDRISLDTFIFKLMENQFNEKYFNNIYNKENFEQGYNDIYHIPKHNWIFDSTAFKYLNELYKNILHEKEGAIK